MASLFLESKAQISEAELLKALLATMQFSLGMWDALFGKKVTLVLPGRDGKPRPRKVTEKWLKEMERQGKAKRLDAEAVPVHILDPLTDYRFETWVVGKDVDSETVEKFRDVQSGALYVLIAYKEGKKQVVVLKKHVWESTKKTMDSV